MISTPLNHRIIYYYTRCLSLSKAVLIPPCDFDSAQSPYYLLLHSVPERSRRHILNSHLGAWACRRHILIPPCDFDSAQSPYYLLLHSVPERSRRHILNSHLGAWACWRHIISIALKSVCFLEHLWCSFGNSKTLLFQQIFVDFVLLKQTQKLYPQWLRQAQPPILLLHGAWACRRHIISIALKSVHSIKHLRCSYENSKTPLFHKISVDFVI